MDKRQRILLIDNYDSFTYNLVQQFEEAGADEVLVVNRDQLDSIRYEEYDKVVISPGPGLPAEAPKLMEAIKRIPLKTSVLGVCLGHQCIATVYGADVRQAKRILHGKTSLIHHSQTEIFHNIPSPFQGARYHSLSIDTVPDQFHKSAWTNDGEIMAISHKEKSVFGVQFHPESFLTPVGSKIFENFLNV